MPRFSPRILVRLLPGLALCVAVALAAQALYGRERRAFGAGHVEALVLAILLGALVRAAWEPGPRFAAASASPRGPCWRPPSSCSAPRSASP